MSVEPLFTIRTKGRNRLCHKGLCQTLSSKDWYGTIVCRLWSGSQRVTHMLALIIMLSMASECTGSNDRAGSLSAWMQTQDAPHWSVIHSMFYYSIIPISYKLGFWTKPCMRQSWSCHQYMQRILLCNFFSCPTRMCLIASAPRTENMLTLGFFFSSGLQYDKKKFLISLADSVLDCLIHEQPGNAWYDEHIILSWMVELDSFTAKFWNRFFSCSVFKYHHPLSTH